MQQVKVFTQETIEKYNKTCSSYTIKRIFKAGDLLWKRMRNSLKLKRDEVLFNFFKKELEILKSQSVKGEIDLCFFDESGFNLKPNVPYAWQEKGRTKLLPAIRGGNNSSFTVLGLLNIKDQTFDGHLYNGAVNEDCVIKFFDDLSLKMESHFLATKKKTIVILDNATIHTSNAVKEKTKLWRARGLFLQFIPAYSPELNLIEILWKQMKHYWLKIEHYSSAEVLKNAIIDILNQYGEKYVINFA